MKKKIAFIVIVILMAIGVYCHTNKNGGIDYDLLNNVEALANGENGGGDVFCYGTGDIYCAGTYVYARMDTR